MLRCNVILIVAIVAIGLDALVDGSEVRSRRSTQYDVDTRAPLVSTGSQTTNHPNTLRSLQMSPNIARQNFTQTIQVTQPIEFDPAEIEEYQAIQLKFLRDSAAGNNALVVCRWVLARILKCFKTRLPDSPLRANRVTEQSLQTVSAFGNDFHFLTISFSMVFSSVDNDVFDIDVFEFRDYVNSDLNEMSANMLEVELPVVKVLEVDISGFAISPSRAPEFAPDTPSPSDRPVTVAPSNRPSASPQREVSAFLPNESCIYFELNTNLLILSAFPPASHHSSFKKAKCSSSERSKCISYPIDPYSLDPTKESAGSISLRGSQAVHQEPRSLLIPPRHPIGQSP